ncbi:hypothetical protein BGX20_005383, partial [Mortierella sp. AD010]
MDLKRRKWRPPILAAETSASTTPDPSLGDNEWESLDQFDLEDILSEPMNELREPSAGVLNTKAGKNAATSKSNVPTPIATVKPTPKRRRVGLSRVTTAPGSTGQSSLVTSHRPPSTQLEFPNAARCTNFAGKNQSQLLRRSMALGSRFVSTNQYKDGMTFLIYEHMQIMVIEIAIAMWSIKSNPGTQDGVALDTLYRSRGIHMHSESTLRRRGDTYSGFPLYNDGASNGGGGLAGMAAMALQPTSQQGLSLSISNKEHHSKYAIRFADSDTMSIYTSANTKDSNVARDMLTHCTKVCAIRLLNAMSEFMMLDNISESLTRTPLLPVLLNYVPPELVKASKTSVFKVPSRVPEKSGCLVLTEEDGIDVEEEIVDTTEKYGLNLEQAAVLRTFAQTVIRAPDWTQKSTESPPIILVHGVFGAGKSPIAHKGKYILPVLGGLYDRHLRFFLNNSKVVLYDAKFNVLDSTFHRGNAITVGDDMDMDRHLITVEGVTEAYAANSIDQRNNTRNGISRSATVAKSTTSTAVSTLKFTSTHTKTTVNGSIPAP